VVNLAALWIRVRVEERSLGIGPGASAPSAAPN
jgi:hypothetical protein